MKKATFFTLTVLLSFGFLLKQGPAQDWGHVETLTGHKKSVFSVAFSPNGQILASASSDKTVRLWNPNTGQQTASLIGHTKHVQSVAFSPNGQILASAGRDNTIRLWNVNTGQTIRTLKGHTNHVFSVAFSPNGQTLASASKDNTIRLWNVNTGQHIRELKGHTDHVFSVAFSPNEQILASASRDNTVRLWNPNTGQNIRTLNEHTDHVFSVAFSPNGRILASASRDNTVRLWNPNTGRNIGTLDDHTNHVYGVAFSPNGQILASGSYDDTVRLWNPNTRRNIAILEGHRNNVQSIAFSPDGITIASGSWDNTVRLWRPAGAAPVSVREEPEKPVSNDPPPSGRGIDIPDPNLRRAIAKVLNKPANTPITQRDMEKLTGLLEAPHLSIADLTGLEFAVNLKALMIDFNNISDISPLRNLTSLITLDITTNPIVDISPLRNLTNLRTLQLSHQQLNDMAQLKNLTNLENLQLRDDDTGGLESLRGQELASVVGFTPTNDGATVISVEPAAVKSPEVGEAFTVNINITGGAGTRSYDLTIDFDPTALEYVAGRHANYLPGDTNSSLHVSASSLFDAFGLPQTTTSEDRISIHRLSKNRVAPDADGTLAVVTFRVVEAKPSTIGLEYVQIKDASFHRLKVTTLDGKVTVDDSVPPDDGLDGEKKNTVTNELPVTIYITFATWLPADRDVPKAGYRTTGYYAIPPGDSHTFPTFRDEPIFVRVQRLDELSWFANPVHYLSPAADTATATSLVPREIHENAGIGLDFESFAFKSFNIWFPRSIQDIPQKDLVALSDTDIPREHLRRRSGFIKYPGGSDISVTHEWRFRDKFDRPTGFTVASRDGGIGVPAMANHGLSDPGDGTTDTTDPGLSDPPVITPDPDPRGDITTGGSQNYTLHAFLAHEGEIHAVTFSPDGTTLASGGNDGQVLLWNPHTEKLKDTITIHDGGFPVPAKSIAFQPNGEILIDELAVAVSSTGQVARAAFEARAAHTGLGNKNSITLDGRHLTGHQSLIRALAFSPDGRTLASGSSDNTIRLWDTQTYQHKRTIQQDAQVWAVAFSPDGQTLATGGNLDGVDLWNPNTGQRITTLEATVAQIEGIAFSPDGQTLAVATGLGSGEALHLWNLQTQQRIETFTVEDFTVRKLAFSLDGEMLAGGAYSTGGEYGVGPGVVLWKRGALADAKIPTDISVDIDIPQTPQLIYSLLKLSEYTLTVAIKNANGQGVPNVEVDVEVEIIGISGLAKEGSSPLPTISKAKWTNDKGEVEIRDLFSQTLYDFFPGKYNVNFKVTAHDRISGTKFEETETVTIEVAMPHSIQSTSGISTPQLIEIGDPYQDRFEVTSVDGTKLEGFSVEISVAGFSQVKIMKSGSIQSHLFIKSPGTHDVDVKVIAGGWGSNLERVLLKKTFPRWVSIRIPRDGTDMRGVTEDLDPVRVKPSIMPVTIPAEEGGFSAATVQSTAAAYRFSRNTNRAWTIADTVADNLREEEEGSVILTVELLEAGSTRTAFTAHHKQLVEDAAAEWQRAGNLLFEFVDAAEGKPSDIRIEIRPKYVREDGKKKQTNHAPGSVATPNIGAPQVLTLGALQKHWNSNEWTMYLRTDAELGTVVHEFGHALGLLHEHFNPTFNEYFEWKIPPKSDEWYKAIMDTYIKSPEIEDLFKKSDDELTRHERTLKKNEQLSLNFNFLYEGPGPPIASKGEGTTDFDIYSVMSYQIPSTLIELTDAAPSKVREVFNLYSGIPANRTPRLFDGDTEPSILSPVDREYIETYYGAPHGRALLTVDVTIEGVDRNKTAPAEHAFESFYMPHRVVNTDKYAAEHIRSFRIGNDCRVEVYLATRNITETEGEAGVYAFLYEEGFGKGGSTMDLDDVDCEEFKFKIGPNISGHFVEKSTAELKLKNESSVVKFFRGNDTCSSAGLGAHQNKVQGDFLANGDTATISITVRGKYIPPGDYTPSEDAPAAPSAAVIANRLSTPKLTGRAQLSDINSDGQVDISDLLLVSNHLGQTVPAHLNVDVNADGTVTIADLVQVAQYLGHSQYAAAPTQFDVPPEVTYALVEGWINEARLENDGSLVFEQGIAKLEYLLTLIIPEKTALLANYPNPFNPETWIPYHLANPARVTLTIYAIDGKVVRRLDLGHQAAGYYHSKSRAAHWDGRNTVGERVATGLYFYTLMAGDFAATQKMLILK